MSSPTACIALVMLYVLFIAVAAMAILEPAATMHALGLQ